MLPRRIAQITEHLIKLYLDSSSNTLPPPVIIKGQSGTGRSWVLNEIKHRLEDKKEPHYPYVIQVPIQLSAANLVKTIMNEISAAMPSLYVNKNADSVARRKIVLLIDNIDQLLNIAPGEKNFNTPERVKGAGAAKFHHIRDVSELRSFLIENTNLITVIASSGENVSFMEDAEQPFFQFFNVIELKPLNQDEIKEFIYARIQSEEECNRFAGIANLLENINLDWATALTEGRITYAKFIVDAFNEIKNERANDSLKDERLLKRLILLFLGKLSPYVDLTIQNLSYTEKKLIDVAVFLEDGFYANQLDNFDGNISQTLKALKRKKIIVADKDGYNAKYSFGSSALKVYLRYYKNGILRDVLSPNRPLIVRRG